ncbi:hypothetical protein Scep_024377 [Stephania cephalantha]|uniref:Uncharacterized protein n=1 Tax=Stephania cephalantha TaxID=152367 RepID=A0AAP0HX26_9MAGN
MISSSRRNKKRDSDKRERRERDGKREKRERERREREREEIGGQLPVQRRGDRRAGELADERTSSAARGCNGKPVAVVVDAEARATRLQRRRRTNSSSTA